MRPQETAEERVVMLRRQRRWTQAELASKIGASLSLVSKAESGVRSYSSRMLKALADAFNVDADWLASGGSFPESKSKLLVAREKTDADRLEEKIDDMAETLRSLKGTIDLLLEDGGGCGCESAKRKQAG
jgi:transcriptional regulator with XRE-family HTH domain